MKKITYFLTVACAIFLGSCASTTFMSIDVMRPATVSFPPDIVNLAVVDNTGIQPDSMNHITISPTKEVTIVKVSSDSAKTTFKQAFVQFMNEENYFNKIELYPHNMRTDSDYDRVQPLKRTEVKEICEAMDADALVSFDIYITSDRKSVV